MKHVPAAVTRTIGRQALHIQKASPKLLLVAGIVGAVGATVLACKATLQLEDILIESQKAQVEVGTQSREASKIRIRTARKVARLYAPAILVGFGSVACITKSHQILSSRNAAATAAYAALSSRFDEYRDRVAAKYGREGEEEIYKDLEACEIDGPDGKVDTLAPSGRGGSPYARFFDHTSKSWERIPESNLYFLRIVQNNFNDLLHARGHVFLNEVYDALGLPRSLEGQFVGWVHGRGDNYISFGAFDNEETLDRLRDFATGREGGIWLDFNVDGSIYKVLGDPK